MCGPGGITHALLQTGLFLGHYHVGEKRSKKVNGSGLRNSVVAERDAKKDILGIESRHF